MTAEETPGEWIKAVVVVRGECLRSCGRCGATEIVHAVGRGKNATFPGWIDWYRAHIKCKAKPEAAL